MWSRRTSFGTVSLALIATVGGGCRYNVDLTGSPRPFAPRDTLVAREVSIGAAGLYGVALVVADGSARVTAGPSDSIRASLVVGPQGTGPTQRRRCPSDFGTGARIVSERTGGTLTLRATPYLRGRCAVAWRVAVPATVALTVRGEVADLAVEDVAGGLTLSTGVGRIRVNVPSGSIEAVVREVGDIDVRSASSDYGDALVRSSVGSVELTVDGHRVDAAQAPGAGERIALRGQGRDAFRIETGVGRARLAIDPRRRSGDGDGY